MRRRILLPLLLLVLVAGCDVKMGPMPPVEVYFSPHGGCTEAVVRELDLAKQTIFVQAYSFTSKEIAEALVEARRRGAVVHVIIDNSALPEDYRAADLLEHNSASILVDAKHNIAHNKVMIIDGQVVITGSFNFTEQAEHSNAENLLVIHDPALAARYVANWHDHEAHSEPYVGHQEGQDRENERHRSKK